MKRELIYAAAVGGCVGALMTMALGLVLPLGAQSQSDGHFDEITCRRLRVVADNGSDSETTIDLMGMLVKGAGLRTHIFPMGIQIRNSNGVTNMTGGVISVKNTTGGVISVKKTDDNDPRAVKLGIDEYGGLVEVFGKGDYTSRAVMGVNQYGNGAISTWDKNGNRLK